MEEIFPEHNLSLKIKKNHIWLTFLLWTRYTLTDEHDHLTWHCERPSSRILHQLSNPQSRVRIFFQTGYLMNSNNYKGIQETRDSD